MTDSPDPEAVDIRALIRIWETMEPRMREDFCVTLPKIVETMKLQIRDYVERGFFSAAKKRSGVIKKVEKLFGLCAGPE